MKTKDIKWTHEQAQTINRVYNCIPEPPKGYEFTGELLDGYTRTFTDRSWLGVSGQVFKFAAGKQYSGGPVLEVVEVEEMKVYRYITENVERRMPADWDWLLLSYPGDKPSEFMTYSDLKKRFPVSHEHIVSKDSIIFRREEVED